MFPNAPCGSEVAVKVSDTSRWYSLDWKFALRKVGIMRRGKHPNVVQYDQGQGRHCAGVLLMQRPLRQRFNLCRHEN